MKRIVIIAMIMTLIAIAWTANAQTLNIYKDVRGTITNGAIITNVHIREFQMVGYPLNGDVSFSNNKGIADNASSLIVTANTPTYFAGNQRIVFYAPGTPSWWIYYNHIFVTLDTSGVTPYATIRITNPFQNQTLYYVAGYVQ